HVTDTYDIVHGTSPHLTAEEPVSTLLENLSLRRNQLANPGPPEFQKLVKCSAAERKPLRCSLDLHELIAVGHDQIEIDVGARVFKIVQVEHRNATDNAHAHRGN